MASAFQYGAFQDGAFQIDSPVTAVVGGGGYIHLKHLPRQKKSAEEIREERIALGIIPAPVEKIVEKVVQRLVSKDRQDLFALLEQEYVKIERQLSNQLQRERIEYQERYMQLIRLEIMLVMRMREQMEQDREDEEIISLLMQM